MVVVTMADGCDDPSQIDQLVRLVERGVVVAAASRYTRGGQQVGGPFLKGILSRLAGLSLSLLARVGTRDATNSFKAYDMDFVRAGRHRVRRRLRDRHRAGGQGPSGPAARWPSCPPSGSSATRACPTSSSHPGSRATCAGSCFAFGPRLPVEQHPRAANRGRHQ